LYQAVGRCIMVRPRDDDDDDDDDDDICFVLDQLTDTTFHC